MKKSDKTELTKEKILMAAITEFGTGGYKGASLNTVCNDYGISKGLIYHNFKSKDELYLSCVDYCKKAFLQYMKENSAEGSLHDYTMLRINFFSNNPMISRIFFEAILYPPESLETEIKSIQNEFDEFNMKFYRSAIKKLNLRDGISEQDALEFYSMMQKMYNGYFSQIPVESVTEMIENHETKLARYIDFMIYGIADIT